MIKPVCALFLSLFLVADLNAGILNGNFSNAGFIPDPFSDWSTDSSFFDRPTDGVGFAQFDSIEPGDPSLPISSIQLAQSFSLDSGSQSLSFELKITAIASASAFVGPVRDSFQVTLFDNSITPVELFPAFPPLFTAFYSIDNDEVTEQFDPNFVTILDIGGGFKRITVNVSSLSPQMLTLDFLLNGNADGHDTRVLLDNVAIHTNTGVVPEPISILVWTVMSGLAFCVKRKRFEYAENLPGTTAAMD
jgi:hypothetical protein